MKIDDAEFWNVSMSCFEFYSKTRGSLIGTSNFYKPKDSFSDLSIFYKHTAIEEDIVSATGTDYVIIDPKKCTISEELSI